MSAYLYGVPAALEGVASADFQGLTMSVAGWNGISWPLSNPNSGLILTTDGLVGLGTGPGDRFTTQSPGIAGSRNRGTRALERPVRWPLFVYSDRSSREFVERDRALRVSLFRRDRTSLWTVTQPATGESRTLEVRFVADDVAMSLDPTAVGWVERDVKLVAEDPYWRGRTIRRDFAAATTEDFIPPGGGPPFVISEGSTLATSTMANPGDVDAWPVWTISGPTTEVVVGIGGSLIGIYGDLDADDVLVIDTDPRRQSAVLNGTRERGILAPHDFAPIPAGVTSSLSLTMVGTGSVRCEIVPRYEAAW